MDEDSLWSPSGFLIDSSRPLYEQFVERIRADIAKGLLKPGSRLPSVRELATRLRVNPNTVMRSYQELERERLIVTQRGQGTFVTRSQEIIEESKLVIARSALTQFALVAESLGMTAEELWRLATADRRGAK